jgi:hypothetical protein
MSVSFPIILISSCACRLSLKRLPWLGDVDQGLGVRCLLLLSKLDHPPPLLLFSVDLKNSKKMTTVLRLLRRNIWAYQVEDVG